MCTVALAEAVIDVLAKRQFSPQSRHAGATTGGIRFAGPEDDLVELLEPRPMRRSKW